MANFLLYHVHICMMFSLEQFIILTDENTRQNVILHKVTKIRYCYLVHDICYFIISILLGQKKISECTTCKNSNQVKELVSLSTLPTDF